MVLLFQAIVYVLSTKKVHAPCRGGIIVISIPFLLGASQKEKRECERSKKEKCI